MYRCWYWHKKSCGGWRMDEARPVVWVSALCFLQCFDTVGWVTGRTSDPEKQLVPPHHHNRFTALLPGPPGWAGARRKLLLDIMVLGRITRGRHTNNMGGHYSIQTNQQSISTNFPHFYAGCPSCRNPANLSWLGTGTGICCIAYPVAWLKKQPMPLITKCSLLLQVEEENWGRDQLTSCTWKMVIKIETVLSRLNWCCCK